MVEWVTVVLAIVLMTTYEYSTLGTGEKSINRENMDSTYYYQDVRERYINIYTNTLSLHKSKPNNPNVYENERKNLLISHSNIIYSNTKGP